MKSNSRCERCGADLAGPTVAGHCANCMLELALKTPVLPTDLDATSVSDFGSPAGIESVTPLREGPGSVIGRYKLLERIGEGGMGVVYLAEQLEPVKRQVAFKIIKLGMDTRAVIARFEMERQTLAMM